MEPPAPPPRPPAVPAADVCVSVATPGDPPPPVVSVLSAEPLKLEVMGARDWGACSQRETADTLDMYTDSVTPRGVQHPPEDA
eukprot:2207981-Pyramimonas_sp.AAC.1